MDAATWGFVVTSNEIALTVAAVLAVLVAPVIILTIRYQKYAERLARGRRNLKPVWKPFWMD